MSANGLELNHSSSPTHCQRTSLSSTVHKGSFSERGFDHENTFDQEVFYDSPDARFGRHPQDSPMSFIYRRKKILGSYPGVQVIQGGSMPSSPMVRKRVIKTLSYDDRRPSLAQLQVEVMMMMMMMMIMMIMMMMLMMKMMKMMMMMMVMMIMMMMMMT